ncbi:MULTISPECIES: DUF4336 domain-containing protein [unclassified Massilia]|uniref:DUF4336 domain-containing protein n=1 Tax=unclassified Massilia TaxID=2609279 RepID=UPI00068E2015|nr:MULTISPECIES: DUF4336 domain-containing protein [unclassified Massilia]ALK96852.2 hypothetical protein AM586_11815 [Massilia sp. WG5]
MLTPVAPNLWHMERGFKAAGLPVTSRMTVVRFDDGRLWLHSPVRFDDAVADQLRSLGTVAWIVAPNRAHHLFARHARRMFPDAALVGAPGLAAKRPDLAGLMELGDVVPREWQHELGQVWIRGMPFVNEVVWFHKASATLIMTDVLQCWGGELDWRTALYARLTGVRGRLDLPRTVRLVTRDRVLAAGSARMILQWPFTRVITAHNSIVERDAHALVERAFAHLGA